MEDKWSFVFVHEILPRGLSYQLLIMCCGGPKPPPVGCKLGNVEPSLTETRDDHFSGPHSSYTTSKQSQFWSSFAPWAAWKNYDTVYICYSASDGLVDHKTLSKNTVYMSLLVVISNPPFISRPFWSSRPLTHKLGSRSVPGKAAFWHGFCSFYFFNRLCFKTELYKNHSRVAAEGTKRSMFSAKWFRLKPTTIKMSVTIAGSSPQHLCLYSGR